MILKYLLDSLSSVLFPAPCVICGRMLTIATRIPICEPCFQEFERIPEPLCACCGRPLLASVVHNSEAGSSQPNMELRCRICRTNFYAFDAARSFAVYNRALSEAILLLKYEQIVSLADWFGTRLAQVALNAGQNWRADVVVPVPLHRDRRRERGYNQAELIARTVARRLSLPLDSRLLIRTKPRPPQLVLSRAEHWKSVRGAYATRDGVKIDNMRVLLVDDVLTTGATLDACSRALKKAGASVVFGLTVGRVRNGATAAIATPVELKKSGNQAGLQAHL